MIVGFPYETDEEFNETVELAKKVGVTRQTIISIEQGKYIASLSLALKIARVFDAKVEDIFTLEEGD
ncbi:MAG: helix-turn-helix domain-containing protein [Acholeplasmatales bacterium]|nr:helix-turn-helix domain-containing protein [Acholeplasmatales bacterium]